MDDAQIPIQASHGLLLDGRGGAETFEPFAGAHPEGAVWVHLGAGDTEGRRWLEEDPGVPLTAGDALRADETRPRATRHEDGWLVVLRGANLNTGEDPVDMVSLRVWLEPGRIITTSRRRVFAVEQTRLDLAGGKGPDTVQGVLVRLVDHLLDNVSPVTVEIEERLDELEDRAPTAPPKTLQGRLAAVRQDVIALRRHLAPQREALARLASLPGELQGDLHELADRQTRLVEDLDELRERATVLHDLISSRLSDALNQKMLLLAVITAVFLPLSLLTGLLGINVGGIPFAASPAGFWLVTLLLGALALAQVWYLRRSRWF